MVTNLKNVKHVPELLLNLMPVEQLVDRELLHTFLIVWKLLRGSLVSGVARGKSCCILYHKYCHSWWNYQESVASACWSQEGRCSQQEGSFIGRL